MRKKRGERREDGEEDRYIESSLQTELMTRIVQLCSVPPASLVRKG